MSRNNAVVVVAAALTIWALGLAACGDDDGGTNTTPDGSVDASAVVDAGQQDAAVPPPYCEALGLPERAFVDAPEDTSLRALAADFTLPTTEGDFVLSEEWTGCDAYLFVLDHPTHVDPAFGYDMWGEAADVAALIEALPSNTHVFFVAVESGSSGVNAALALIRDNVDAALLQLTPEAHDHWQTHMHYVSQSIFDVEGWLGNALRNPGFGIGIDRMQRIRYIGAYGSLEHYDGSLSWPFGPDVSMAANEAVYYNYEADREDRLAEFPATVIPIFDGTPVAEGNHQSVVELPDPATMAGFDTLELDMSMTCGGEGELGYCPAWDYNVFLRHCETVDATTCDQQVGQWITSYHREGRWVHDVSGLLPLLDSGGPHRFSLSISDPWVINLNLRLSNHGKAHRPDTCHILYPGRSVSFNPTYNDSFPEVDIDIPSDAPLVELVTSVTGHGMSNPGNCAEFCDTYHHYYVNGAEYVRHFDTTGDNYGCMKQIPDGTVPNQSGTWWFGRGGWCPGKQVDLETWDVTSDIVPGATNTFSYEAFYNNQPYQGDSWVNIVQASYVVVYR